MIIMGLRPNVATAHLTSQQQTEETQHSRVITFVGVRIERIVFIVVVVTVGPETLL